MPEDTLRDRDERGWLAPLISAAITLPFAAFAFLLTYFLAAFDAMACDPCTPAEVDHYGGSFETGLRVFHYGLVVPLVLLLASWGLPWRSRHSTLRTVLAVLAPLSVLLSFLLFIYLVDWPG